MHTLRLLALQVRRISQAKGHEYTNYLGKMQMRTKTSIIMKTHWSLTDLRLRMLRSSLRWT